MKNLYLPQFKSLVFCATLLIIFSAQLNAQVGVNTTSPSGGSILDVVSSNKGMLVPRVDIANLNTIAPVTGGGTESLLVYNTNTTTGKGFYYWDGTKWVSIGNTTDDDWDLNGNAGTDPENNYIGTSDAQPLVFGSNGTEHMRLLTNGFFGINTTTASEYLDVNGDIDIGGDADGYDADGENVRFRARSRDWWAAAENNADPDLSDFYIATTQQAHNAQFKITPAGFVNIGQDNEFDPQDMLHVTKDDENETTTIRIDNTRNANSIAHTALELWDGSNTTSSTSGIQAFFRANNKDKILEIGHAKANGVVNFYSGDGSGSTSDISLRLEADGKVTVENLINIKPGSAPSSPVEGDVYYDSSSKKLRVYTGPGGGNGWKDLH